MSGPISKSVDADTDSVAAKADAQPSTQQPAPKTGGTPLAKPVPPGSNQPVPKDGAARTVAIKLLGKFENRPGATTKGVNDTSATNALWVELGIMSTSPTASVSTLGLGLTRGGSKLIGSYDAPLGGGAHPRGTGEVSTELKYADDLSKSFNVVVTGIKGNLANATSRARALVVAKSKTQGDVAKVIGPEIENALREEFHSPDARVEITAKDDKRNVTDAGTRTLYYRVDSPVTILMNFDSVTAAEASVHTGHASDKGAGSGAESESHGSDEQEHTRGVDEKAHKESHNESSEEKTSQRYSEAVAKTTEAFTQALGAVRTKLRNDAVEAVIKSSRGQAEDKTVSKSVDVDVVDYTEKVDTSAQNGSRPKQNWASKFEELLGIGKAVADHLPSGGPWSFGLGLLQKGVGLFAVKGSVAFNDGHGTKDGHDKTIDAQHRDSDRKIDSTRHDETALRSMLIESFDRASADFVRHAEKIASKTSSVLLTEVIKHSSGGSNGTESDSHTKDSDKHSGGSSARRKSDENTKTHIEYDVTTKERFMRPILEATVVNGRGEVSSTPFGSDGSNE